LLVDYYEGYWESKLHGAINKASNDKNIDKYKKKKDTLKLLLNVVTAEIEAFVILGSTFLYACVKEVSHVLTSLINSLLLNRCDRNQFFMYINRW
jgi:hypothetical protein